MALSWRVRAETGTRLGSREAPGHSLGGLGERAVFALVEGAMRLRFAGLVRRFEEKIGASPAIAAPVGYHDKLLWRKLFDRDPRAPVVSDKLAVRDFVRERCPELRIPSVAWVGTSAEDVPDEYLSGPWVIKTNHGWDQNHFSALQTVPRSDFNRRFADYLAEPWGRRDLERGYRGIPRRIFVEEMVTGPQATMVAEELKAHVFGGVTRVISYIVGRQTEDQSGALYSRGGTRIEAYVKPGDRRPATQQPHPEAIAAAVAAAERLGADFDYIRADFYAVGPKVCFSELTLYPDAGYLAFSGPQIVEVFAEAWDLRQSWFLRAPQPWPLSVYADALRRSLDRDDDAVGVIGRAA